MRRTTAFFWANASICVLHSAIAYAPVGILWSLAAAGAGALLIVGLWFIVRRVELPATALLALQAALVLHYVGLVPLDGSRIYALSVGGIRYDKIVHLAASFCGVFGTAGIIRFYGVRLGRTLPFVLLFMVLGFGALVENIEYAAVESYGPRWDAWLANETLYDNDMQDMLANLLGAALGVACLMMLSGKPSGRQPALRTPLSRPAGRPSRYASSRGRGA